MPQSKKGFAAAVAAAKPITKSIRLCLDGDLIGRLDRLGEQFLEALRSDEESNGPDQAPQLQAQIQELAEQAKAAEVEFTFRTLGRLGWHDLIAQHPPSKEQRELGYEFDPQTFPAAAMAAACVSPEGADVAGFESLSELLNDGQWNRLWATCHAANTAGGDVPNLAAAFALVRPTATS